MKRILALVISAVCADAIAQPCEYPIVDLTMCRARTERADHVATVNGCGPSWLATGMVPQGSGAASFKPGCDEHDLCYEKCNKPQAQCDAALEAYMKASCLTAYSPSASHDDESWGERATCLSLARNYARLVRSSAGKSANDAAQKIACECCRGWSGTVSYSVSGNEAVVMPTVPAAGSTQTGTTNSSAEVTGSGTMTFSRTDDPNSMVMTAASGSWSQKYAYGDTAQDLAIHCPFSVWSENSSDYSGACVLPPLQQRTISIYVIDGTVDFAFQSLPGTLTGADRAQSGGTVTPASMPPACAPVMPTDVSTPGSGSIRQDLINITDANDGGSAEHAKGTASVFVGTQPVRKYEVRWDFTHQ